MVTRADKYTQIQKKEEFFSDFLNNFDPHPITNSLARVTNEQSVTQSLKNLIYTNFGDRVFEPRVGSNVLASLFEPNDVVTGERISNAIKSIFLNYEPRAGLLNVIINPSADNNSLEISVLYYLLNNPTNALQFDFILKRVR